MNEKNMKVLLVDDEKPILTAMEHFPWEKYHCTLVGKALNGKEALSLVDALFPDIVFLDISMPQMNGLEFLKIAKNRHPETKFIIYSAFCEFSYAREAIRLGATDYLAKGELTDEEFGSYLLKIMALDLNPKKESYNGRRYEVQFLLDEVNRHFSEQISLDKYASILGLSTNYLGSLFLKDMGIHFKDYLKKVRMERAYQLLKYTPLRVFEVADQVGYTDPQYFTTVFTKYFNITPGQVK